MDKLEVICLLASGKTNLTPEAVAGLTNPARRWAQVGTRAMQTHFNALTWTVGVLSHSTLVVRIADGEGGGACIHVERAH